MAACALLVGCVTGKRPVAESPALLLRDGVPAEAARGIWRSRGYGLVLSISEGGSRLHHETSAGCYADPGGEDSLLESLVYFTPGASPDELVFVSHPGETRYLFQRLPALPTACGREEAWTAPRLLDVFAATFAEQYAFFPERGVDWSARVSALRPRVTAGTDARALFGVFTEALKGLEDAHTGLHGDADGEPLEFSEGQPLTVQRVAAEGAKRGASSRDAQRAWLASYREGILQTLLKGAGHHVANNRVFHGRIGDLGYLNVVTMGGFAEGEPPLEEELRVLNAALDEALTSFQGARAVIVDVSNNRGGHDLVGRTLAARFTDSRRLAYTKRPRNVDVPPQPFHVEPSQGPRFTGPVYLLTSDITVSAAEVFTLCMRALPNVTHVGTPTRGALSDVLAKPLPNGWRMELSNEIYLDAQGTLFEARGIPPQHPLEVFPEEDLHGGHARAVLSLVELARQRAR
jgi:carboxyl-terminal processing protease